MSKAHALVVIFFLCLGSNGLIAQQRRVSADRPNGGGEGGANPQAKPEEMPSSPYIIGDEDILDISVWGEPNVSRSVPVRPDGKISIPLVNDIQAAGLTPMQLSATITEKLKKFLTNPRVTVTVTAIYSQRVFVVGEVAKPGPLPLFPNMTALQAVAAAGGPTQFADQKHAYLLRLEGEKETTYPLNYKDLLRGSRQGNIVLKAGDTIVVP